MLGALVAGVCSKSDLIDEVWTRHGTVVTENSYYQLVSLLRKSFASIDLAGTVVTLPRKGLTLTAEQIGALANADRAADSEPYTQQASSACEFNREFAGDALVQQHILALAETAAEPAAMELEPDGSANKPVERPNLTHPGPEMAVHGDLACEAPRSPDRTSEHTSTHASRRRSAIPLAALAALGALIAGTAGLSFGTWLSDRHSTHVDASMHTAQYASVDPAGVANIDLHYADMPEATALRIWQDVEARAGLPLEQRAHVFISEYRNRYAVLACSGLPDFPATQCFTVTESL